MSTVAHRLGEHFAFVEQLSPPARERLLDGVRWYAVEPRTPLLCKGDAVEGVFLVLRGSLRVYYQHEDGRQGTLYFVDPGQACFLSLNGVMSGDAYPAWSECDLDRAEFVAIPGPLFRAMFTEERALQTFAFETLGRRVADLMVLVEETACRGMEQRIGRWLVAHIDPGGRVRVSQERLARHLGTAREVVARILRRFREQGWIRTSRGVIEILDPTEIEALTQPGHPPQWR